MTLTQKQKTHNEGRLSGGKRVKQQKVLEFFYVRDRGCCYEIELIGDCAGMKGYDCGTEKVLQTTNLPLISPPLSGGPNSAR